MLLDITITKKHRNMITHRRDAGGKDFNHSQDASESGAIKQYNKSQKANLKVLCTSFKLIPVKKWQLIC